ncbi:MAG: hypothetical protein COA71_00910 [SAR86 cluster bacterium]|uniref:VWFA domain-containing protein n=1 Tax=SAR86 cluster bacterium TaxID=2030880 RepID=A0A2A5CHU9_9GAMM|nr:BatA and WFA domain-containing protein [Gammaproteobacteria bacterium AH-315-E17]PCJ43464.1 MAG: hypothetical protein COA71_00910 [SAR86 cluster bacterium]
MSLLSPLFLFALLGIALPIWLHRLQTNATEREKFSSIMFMEQSQQRVHIQRQLKYLLLMALRILFLVLLVLAFTKPVFFVAPDAAVTEDTTHHVIVLDTSFSMREGGSFDQAIALAEGLIDNMGTDDIASLYTASGSVETITAATADTAVIRGSLNDLSPDNGRLDIGAMVTALDSLIASSQANFIIHFISDYQQSGQAVRFADMIPDVINGRPVTLNIHQVKTQNIANWSVASVEITAVDTVRIGLKNNSDADQSAEKTVTLSINDLTQQNLTETFAAPADGISYLTFENVLFEEGDNRLDVNVSPNDSFPEDDIRHTVFDNSPPAPVILLSADPESLAVTYITTALETAPRGYEVELQNINDFDPRILQRYPWIVIDDIGAVNESLAQELQRYVDGGGAILAAVGERTLGQTSIPVGGQTIDGGLTFNRNTAYSIQRVNTAHPVLDGSVGWNNLAISRVLPIETDDTSNVLINLNDDIPFLIERNIGLGRFLLLNTDLNNTWSDLPVKPVFVSFIAEAARHLSNEELLVKEQTINSFLQLGQNGGASGQVYAPSGDSLLSLADTTQAQSIQLTETGYYRIVTLGRDILVAVNPDARESDLNIMDAQTLQNWETMVAGSARSMEFVDGIAVSIAEEESVAVEIWRVLLILLAVIVLTESLLGNRYLRFNTGNTSL